MSDDVRRRALHESGHALAAYALGRRLAGLSVVPGRRWAGTSHFSTPRTRVRDWGRLDPDQPLSMWPATVRRAFETRALIAAAGVAAESALWWATRREAVRLPDRLAEQVRDATPLPGADLARLMSAEAATTGLSDVEVIERLATAVYPASLDLRVAWVHWVEAEARQIIVRSAPRIERLAAVLADRGRLGGRAATAILAASG